MKPFIARVHFPTLVNCLESGGRPGCVPLYNCILLEEKVLNLSKMWSVRNRLCQSRKKLSVKWYFDPHGEFEIKTLASGGIREGQWMIWQRFFGFFNITDWYKRHTFLVFFSFFTEVFCLSLKGGGILNKGRLANLISVEGSKSSSNGMKRAAAAAAKSLQSCPILCDPIDGSPPGSSVAGILQARTLEWVAISFSNAWKWEVKVKSLSCVRLLATPWTAAYQAPPSMGFSRQEYWSGVPLPSPLLACNYSQLR